MSRKIIGIAGGSGAGKSTVCYKLVDNYPDIYEVINLDDYQKKKTDPDLPMINEKINWDHPDIIDWDKLAHDIKKLVGGTAVTIDAWSHRSNPDYARTGKMIPRTINPKPIILLEGYLALCDPKLNELFTRKYYLQVDDGTRNARRGKNQIIDDPTYLQEILIPMHKRYVEPTRKNADEVIDVSDMTVPKVAELIHNIAGSSLRRQSNVTETHL